jgi:hypothetical protein
MPAACEPTRTQVQGLRKERRTKEHPPIFLFNEHKISEVVAV